LGKLLVGEGGNVLTKKLKRATQKILSGGKEKKRKRASSKFRRKEWMPRPLKSPANVRDYSSRGGKGKIVIQGRAVWN